MKIKNAGYIKLHRKFLKSSVHTLGSSTICLFIDLLLLANENGIVEASLTELQGLENNCSRHTIVDGLKRLQEVNAISMQKRPKSVIKLSNWETYQAFTTGAKNAPVSGAKNAPVLVQKMHHLGAKNAPVKNETLKVPVQLDIKEYKNLFKNRTTEKNSFSKTLNILNPTTDLEKLIKYYLQLTNHPGFEKPNANDVLNLAVQQDIPNFEIVLANCKNVTQAAKCVRQFIEDANGTYNLFYLPKQINSVRQKVAAKERREEEERKRREEEYAEYQRILAEDENARNGAD